MAESGEGSGGRLVTAPNLDDPDGTYEAIAHAHRGLDAAESARLNLHLVLVLANHVGRREIVEEAIRVAKSVDADAAG